MYFSLFDLELVVSPYLGDGWIEKLRMQSDLLEVVETPIARRGVEGNTEGVAITLLEVDICVSRCFLFLELLFKPSFELTFDFKFVLFRDFRPELFEASKEIFFFTEQICLGFKGFVVIFVESGEGLLKLIFIALCVIKDSFAFLRDIISPITQFF